MITLYAKDISFGYYKANPPLLEKMSLSLSPGKRIALIGKNGSGKTTLSLLLAGILQPWTGDVLLNDVSVWNDAGRENFRRNVGYVFQNPDDGFIADNVRRELAFGAENYAVPQKDMHHQIESLLEQFGLMPMASHSPLSLPGGMKARLAVASAIATGAKFLILDEPEAFLDAHGQRALEKAISKIANDTGILSITQSPEIVRKCDAAFIIKNGKLIHATENDCAFHIPDISTNSHPTDKIALSLRNINFAYDDVLVIKNVSFDIRQGEITGIIGASGSGKTTLALVCAGILTRFDGSIERNGRISLALQFPERQLFADTVLDDVQYGPMNLGIKDARNVSADALELVGLEEQFWERSPFLLSDGQQRRAGLAGVIAVQPDILILDEPFATLDNDGILRTLKLIVELAERKKSVMIITHRTDILAKIAPRVIALLDGEIEYDGDTKALLQNEELCERIGVRPIGQSEN